jgi:hypothetical protein
VFAQDLFKPSIRLEEDISEPTPETSPDDDDSIPMPGAPPGEDVPVPMSKADPGPSVGLIKLSPGPEGEVAAIIRLPSPTTDWRRPISKYLHLGTIPDDETKTQRLVRRAKGYLIYNDELYQYTTMSIPPKQGKALLLDVHEGICGHHTSSRSMVAKAFRQGFCWLTVASDATQIVRFCRGCQYFARQIHDPTQGLQMIPITNPFVVWGLDLLGPFKKVPEGLTHLLVAVDKFTKWIEVKPLAKIGSKQAIDFIQDIIFRFRVPNSIITDNDT